MSVLPSHPPTTHRQPGATRSDELDRRALELVAESLHVDLDEPGMPDALRSTQAYALMRLNLQAREMLEQLAAAMNAAYEHLKPVLVGLITAFFTCRRRGCSDLADPAGTDNTLCARHNARGFAAAWAVILTAMVLLSIAAVVAS
jgi:hypothetical protein